MKIIQRLAPIAVIIAALCFIDISNVSAESYESSVGLSFTLNPTITVSVSGDLSINNLSPGDYKDSNIILVTAESNAVSGYSLSSTVGNSTHTSPSFNNTNLNHSNGTNTFTNLSTNKASLSAFDENTNTWGYSWCDGTCNAGTDPSLWVSGSLGSTSTGYNGLPIYTTDSPIQLVNSSTSGASTISFKIGARSTTNQIAGEYTNIINFTALAKPNPTIPTLDQVDNMQDFFSCTLTKEGTTNTLTDTRDGKSYTVTKLKDGNCWMTTNLNLAGGTALSADDTDVSSNYINSFTTSNNLTKTGNTIVLPASSTSGFDTNNYSYVYNSNSATCAANTPCYGYYSWDAAILGSGRNISTENTDAPYSICPKGWHLPNTRTGTDGLSDFRALIITLGGSASIQTYNSTTIPTSSVILSKLRDAPSNFVLAGDYTDNSFNNGGRISFYWTKTVYSSGGSLTLTLGNTIYSANNNTRKGGRSVRCLRSL